jgi:iron complex outermembrane receptor protein
MCQVQYLTPVVHSGASILVKGTSNGAQTDLDGKFTIRNVGANAVLIFTYIGLKQQEVNVAGKLQ